MPKLNQPPGAHAIIDDRRSLGGVVTPEVPATVTSRRTWRLPQSAAPACGLVLDGPLLPAIQGAAREPLAFTVQDIANGLTAGGAAVACRVAERGHGGFVAAWPIAERKGKKVSAA